MKNPLELSMLEVSAMMREAGTDAPEADYTRLMAWIRERQKYLHDYAVQKQIEEVRTRKQDVSRREARSLESELLDNAPIEFVDLSA